MGKLCSLLTLVESHAHVQQVFAGPNMWRPRRRCVTCHHKLDHCSLLKRAIFQDAWTLRHHDALLLLDQLQAYRLQQGKQSARSTVLETQWLHITCLTP